MSAINGWQTKRFDEFGELFSGSTPPTTNNSYWDGSIVWITPADLSKLNSRYIHESGKQITERGLNACSTHLLPVGSIVLSSRAPIGYVALPTVPFCTNQGCKSVKLKKGFDSEFAYYNILFNIKKLKDLGEGTTFAEISKTALAGVKLDFPHSVEEQSKIAEILSTVDRAIEETEVLIAKQQRIKTGLMQDLLTRGIDDHGNVRSEQCHEFKDSPLGRLPVEWEVNEFGRAVATAVDGPFGSNLKSEHYVDEPGVRVIRLGNVGNGDFLDGDKAFISIEHAERLRRHSAEYGDLLVASLGDERHLFGRACLYTDNVHRAIVKADVFRIRCRPEKYFHPFAMQLFNFPRWRKGLFGLAQGVTRDRVNLTNLMRLQLPRPPIEEQKAIARVVDGARSTLCALRIHQEKLTSIKAALMHDLLTGRKRVTALLEPESKREKVYAS